MIKFDAVKKMNEEERFKYLLVLLEGQLSSEEDVLCNLCNSAALIKALVDDLNWAGFYFIHGEELVLGPFQGLPACNRIKIGNGVCGTSVATRSVQRIFDVHQFEGHIACDSHSNSELVIPIIKNDVIYGVLDLDSPTPGRFTEILEKYMIKFVTKLNEYIEWEREA